MHAARLSPKELLGAGAVVLVECGSPRQAWKLLLNALGMVSWFFWTLDMFLSFGAPYEVDGVPVWAWRKTACHYLKRSFVLDLALVVLDWLTTIMSLMDYADGTQISFQGGQALKDKPTAAGSGKDEGRPLPTNYQVDHAPSAESGMEGPFSFVIGRYLVIFAMSVHYGACCWYYLLRAQSDFDELWGRIRKEQIGEEILGVDPDKHGMSYLTGVYFTVVALVSCSSWLSPSNKAEKALALVPHVFGWILSSLSVSVSSACLVGIQARLCQRRQA